ncbi:hypothetical protein AGMMS49944_21940 [Spirochaetia bacterium]|nr:hypothetical protein AGMMS49944_21940 [Spirochaetia bacterium]
MRKVVISALIVLMAAGNVFAKDNLAILPFLGGQGDEGEAIAELFSFDPQLNEAFTPIPRTSITNAKEWERFVQTRSGLTDVDTIADIGKELGARYVMAGNITTIGNSNLLVLSIYKDGYPAANRRGLSGVCQD